MSTGTRPPQLGARRLLVWRDISSIHTGPHHYHHPPPQPPQPPHTTHHHDRHHHHHTAISRKSANFLCVTHCVRMAAHERCPASQATTALVVATRAAVDRRGAGCCDAAERRSTEPEDSHQGQGGGGARDVRRATATDDSTSGDPASTSVRGGWTSGSHSRLRCCCGCC